MAYLSAIDAFAQVTTQHFVSLALTIQVATLLCLSPYYALTHPAGYLFPRPFPFFNENSPPPAHAGAPFPVQHDPFPDSI